MRTSRAKGRARDAVNKAIRDGVLVRGRCEQEASGVCNGRIEAHHDDYGKALDVRWLCRRHHARFHQDHPETGLWDGKRDSRSAAIAVYLPAEAYERLRIQAESDNRSMSNQIRVFVMRELDRIEAQVATR